MVSLLARPCDLEALRAVRAVAAGERSVVEIAAAALERASDLEGEIRSFRLIDEGAVGQAAKELDSHAEGTLRGVTVGVKDVIDTADLPTGYGSPLFAEHQPGEDAACVKTLRAAGALVLGKTESTEFAMFEPARTRNPHDVTRTPGGSSSGSAAAVAAGIVSVALGTQTAGSVVRPAAYCGVYGMKPSRGWTPTAGVWLLAESLDTLGLFARRAEDLELVYRSLRNPAFAQRRRERPARRAAAVMRAAEWAESDREVHDALDDVARRLSRSGWHVSELQMPPAWRPLAEAHSTVMDVEVAMNMRASLGPRVGLISEKARTIVARGDETSAAAYLDALRIRTAALAPLGGIEESFDVILAPSALGVAPEGLEFTGDPVMCRPWTLLGLPCANVPAVSRSDGLPVGVQAVGAASDDVSFLEALVSIETAIWEEKSQ